MGKFIGYTVGLECNKGDQFGKSIMVEYSHAEDGHITLTPVSARNMGVAGASRTITAGQFDRRPQDAHNKIAEARWALELCGWSLMADDYNEANDR